MLTVPPAKNYQSPLVAVRSIVGRDPVEGPMQIPIEIDWTTMGAQQGSITTWATYINLQNLTTQAFSQVCGLKVDNSQCGSDVQIIFTDTQEIITIPAYEPLTVVPVFTAATQFYAVALNAIGADTTRIQVLNFVPPPVTVPESPEHNFALTSGLAVGNANVNTTFVPAGVNGTLEILQLNFSTGAGPAAASTGNLFIQDGKGNYLVNSISVSAGPNTQAPGQIILDLKDVRWRFQNGLIANWLVGTGGWSNGAVINITAAYRTP